MKENIIKIKSSLTYRIKLKKKELFLGPFSTYLRQLIINCTIHLLFESDFCCKNFYQTEQIITEKHHQYNITGPPATNRRLFHWP